jgi:response regulator RpfG family c-di-GMP phosphodiesterase
MSTDARARVLLVDDEPNVLESLRRQLRREFAVETAVGAANGLATLGRGGPFAVVVSDFMMPGINGADFLAAARRTAPLTTRMLLTGQANLQDAADVINKGQVFRMLLKPVDHETLVAALHACLEQHRLLVAERELLEQTLHGSVKALTDVLSLTSPAGFGRAMRMRQLVTQLLDRIEVDERWPIELAAMMSQLGVVTLPPGVFAKVDAGGPLTDTEQRMVDAMPSVAINLLSSIPRMAPVCDAILYSRKDFDGSGPPRDGVAGDRIPLGGRVLRLAQDYDILTVHGVAPAEAYAVLEYHRSRYDPALLKVLAQIAAEADSAEMRSVQLLDLVPGMILAADVCTRAGTVLVARGQEVTVGLIARLRNFAATSEGVEEPVIVRGSCPDLPSGDDRYRNR